MPSLADLIRMGKQYIGDAMPGGSLNPETEPVAKQANYLSGILDPASQVSQDATNWHKRTQNGLMDQLAGRDTPEAEQAYQTMMMAAGMAPIGMTAWHGSPHKFDKFSLDKIGTGEGAQAYGHGLYLAEHPGVAQEYQKNLSQFSRIDGKPLVGNKAISSGARTYLLAENADLPKAIQNARDAIARKPDNELLPPILAELESLRPESITKSSSGQLYKTDIPDEAVARFLDWDKPLSQQAPEVQKLLEPLGYSNKAQVAAHDDALMAALVGDGSATLPKINDPMGSDIARGGGLFDGPDQVRKAQRLRELGIPGIRYLDGGSRSAGQGSSNFVAFDPEMIRILERNGQATGLEPWKPGEYRLKDLIGKE